MRKLNITLHLIVTKSLKYKFGELNNYFQDFLFYSKIKS